MAESKLTPLLSLAKVKYTFLDHVLGSGPKFSYTLERNSATLRDFGSHVDRLTNVDFARKETTKNDLLLNVRLPKYGTYVDIADLLDLTAKTSAVRRARAPGVRVVTATDFGFGTRVRNIKLPKSGTSVSVEPLFKLAMKTAEPRARTVMSADLSFEEIL